MPSNAQDYRFDSIEIKETSFRLDGVFLPPDSSGIVYFCEVQFQLDELLYERILSEVALYLYRHRSDFFDWRVVAIYPSKKMEQFKLEVVSDLLASGRILRVYLDELGQIDELPIGLGLILLTTFENDLAATAARSLIERTSTEPNQRAIINLVSTIIVYKFTALTRDEVSAMLGIGLQETRVYQEAKAEGRVEEGQALVLRQLTCKLGKISTALQKEIRNLSIDQIESSGEALLDFSTIADLKAWLAVANPKPE